MLKFFAPMLPTCILKAILVRKLKCKADFDNLELCCWLDMSGSGRLFIPFVRVAGIYISVKEEYDSFVI